MASRLGPESPHTAGKRRSCCSNIVTKFTGSKITGQGFGRGTQVRGGEPRGRALGVRRLVEGDRGLASGALPDKEDVVPRCWLGTVPSLSAQVSPLTVT
ncbi:unnamed protein product [Tetraodon nigroviridis]|uniref:Chromosome 11 SCAF14528, whole genome shotgun sequence n=1 Tax=Tetraodon nigroviridis TaxID=99883 RepID=Q4SR71_TETNG|nr:unnamed protein product [Tetraodon nigroviridis]